MMFIKSALFSAALNFIIIGFASAYYFVIPQIYFSRSDEFAKLYYKCKSCAIATKNAIIDFEKEDYKIIIWGLGSESDSLFFSTLLADYNVKAINGGCTSISEMNCYNIKIHELLFNKLGKNFLNKAYKKATLLNKSLHE